MSLVLEQNRIESFIDFETLALTANARLLSVGIVSDLYLDGKLEESNQSELLINVDDQSVRGKEAFIDPNTLAWWMKQTKHSPQLDTYFKEISQVVTEQEAALLHDRLNKAFLNDKYVHRDCKYLFYWGSKDEEWYERMCRIFDIEMCSYKNRFNVRILGRTESVNSYLSNRSKGVVHTALDDALFVRDVVNAFRGYNADS